MRLLLRTSRVAAATALACVVALASPVGSPAAAQAPQADPAAVQLAAAPLLITAQRVAAPRRAGNQTNRNQANRNQGWTPPGGVLFNSPFANGGTAINARVVKTIRNTPKGAQIRIIMWNIDHGPIVDALLHAAGRGVQVQVITSHTTDNSHWNRLRAGLNGKGNANFARACRGACRSKGPTVHSKMILIDRIRKVNNIVMVGSLNLTYAAASNQWNDLLTFRNDRNLYRYLVARFNESKRDRPLPRPYQQRRIGQTQVTMYPAGNRNPPLEQLRQVRCTGAAPGFGNAQGRTVVRIAIAGWFQAYGADIAKRVRNLWRQGCDIRIVTTLAGGGINRILRDGGPRGPVPIRQLAIDENGDGVPNKYLHTKMISVNGVFGGNNRASVVITGSPNWSEDARRADEVAIRVTGRKNLTMRYQRQMDVLFNSRYARGRTTAQRVVAPQDLVLDDPNSEFSLY